MKPPLTLEVFKTEIKKQNLEHFKDRNFNFFLLQETYCILKDENNWKKERKRSSSFSKSKLHLKYNT